MTSDDSVTTVMRTEWRGAGATSSLDRVAREEPLEIRVGGIPLAVVMRTPGHDEELVRGFLVTERIVDHPQAIASIRHCTIADTPEAEDNVVQVVLQAGIELDLARLRRNLYASSSCGICGKATLAGALATAPPLDDATRVSSHVLYRLPQKLREAQRGFDETGGLHAAGLFSADGETLVVREDIGRHNAVDKVIGEQLLAGKMPLSTCVMMVSGRASFEIMQKAVMAGIPVVAAVGAPSSLAVSVAAEFGLTLIGFLRGERFNIYSGAEQIGV